MRWSPTPRTATQCQTQIPAEKRSARAGAPHRSPFAVRPVCSRSKPWKHSRSASCDVYDNKHHNPDGIDEMPVVRQDLETFLLFTADFTQQEKRQNGKDQNQSHGDVGSVQTDERIVRCTEQIRADGQPLVINQPVPLDSCFYQEDRSQHKCDRPPQTKTTQFLAPQRGKRQMNRDAAGKQADGCENRQFQNLRGRRTRNTLADVKQVGHHKNYEDGRFRRNEAEDAHMPPIGQIPLALDGCCCRSAAHAILPGLSPYPDLPDASGPKAGGGLKPSESARSCIRAVVTTSTIRASRHPTDHCRQACRQKATIAGSQRK